MRFGVTLPPFERWADPGTIMDMAAEAEAAGWDGFFLDRGRRLDESGAATWWLESLHPSGPDPDRARARLRAGRAR